MNRCFLTALALVFVACSTAARGQGDFSNVKIKTTHVAGRVYMLEGRGGNMGVSVGDDGMLLVDDQFAPLADKIKAALRALGDGKLKFVLNTHWHGDHTGGNAEFSPDAPVIAHANVRVRLSKGQQLLGRVVKPSPPEALPVVTFDESLSIHFNGEEIRVIHFPHGHTDGDSIIFFTKSNVVHMGDHYFAGMFPFVDLGSGGDVEGLTRNVAKVIAEVPNDVKFIPGHGPLSTLSDLKGYHRMLVECTAAVRKGMSAGKSLDQLKAAGVPPEWDKWGDGFIKTDKWIETIHDSLQRSR